MLVSVDHPRSGMILSATEQDLITVHFRTKELIHPLCSFAAANLASSRDYWRERPGHHSDPGFVFQRSISDHTIQPRQDH
jgi:hypothetical protein